MAQLDFNWCLSTLPILKWLEIIFCVIIIALIEACVYCWGGYGFMMFAAASCLCITVLTLIIYFFKIHTQTLKGLPWRHIEVGFNIFAVLVFVISFALGIYHCVEIFNGRIVFWWWNSRLTNREWRNRLAAATAFSGMNTILYLLSAIYANRGLI